MPFQSILFDEGRAGAEDAAVIERASAPPSSAAADGGTQADYVSDLHLSDIVAAIARGHDEPGLESLYLAPLRDTDAITYRHEVFRDLEDAQVMGIVRTFAASMRDVRNRLTLVGNVHYRYERERWFLDAAAGYAEAVTGLADALADAPLASRGLLGFRDHLARYVASEPFRSLVGDTGRVAHELATVRYRLRVLNGKVIVTPFRPEPDYGAEVLAHFAKFKQGDGRRYEFETERWANMNHVEAAIVDGVARQHPRVFASLDAYCDTHRDFLDPTIARFDREVRFYVAFLEHIAPFRAAGLPFCYPEVNGKRGVIANGLFDLALAGSLGPGAALMPNDLTLDGPERVVIVSGPNQGGKTTFARAIGQLHHLARVGVLVPGTRARLPLVDRIFTHFERQEQVDDLSSKLEDDLRRIHAILAQATPDSLLIMNESFSSTTVDDQLFIGRRVVRQIVDRGLSCVVVTFLDELVALDPTIVSMVSTVDPEQPARRTFRIVRRPPDGLAYALAIAEKHRLTYPGLKARLTR